MRDKNAELLGNTNVKKALITLSIPAMIGMLVNASYNLFDSLFVGWGAGELAIGGLTLPSLLSFMMPKYQENLQIKPNPL